MTSTVGRVLRTRTLHTTIALAWALAACGGDDDTDTTDAPAPSDAVDVDTTDVDTTDVDTTDLDTTDVDTTEPADGFTFTPPEGDYSIVFPAEPSTNAQTVPLPDGTTLPLTFYLVSIDAAAYGTAALEYPAGTAVSIEGSRDGALANISATLTASEPITLQGRPGLQFSATMPDGRTYLSRVFVDGVRLYQVIDIVAGAASFDDPDVAAFFDSFRFTEDR